MFEIKLTVKAENICWLKDEEDNIKTAVERAGGAFDCGDSYGNREIVISCDNRNKETVVKGIKAFISDIYCNELKRAYFLKRLRLPMLKG